MAQVKFEVTYRSGEKKRALCTPNAMWDAEEKFGGINASNQVRASLFLAWASLRDSGQEPAPFDQWRKDVVDVDELGDDEVTAEDVDPTQPELSSTGSAD